MHIQRSQRTIAEVATVSGFGYWSGKDVQVEFHPAAAESGVVFVRTDLEPAVRIPALVEHRIESPRRTALRHRGATVELVEHVLAALAGLCIDNCEVHVNAAELPGMDGSSLAFVAALTAAGIVQQSAPRARIVVQEMTRLADEDRWIEVHPPLRAETSVKFRLDYGRNNAIGRQTLEMNITPASFARDLAPCRTFLLKHEADWLQAQGLGKRATAKDLLVFDEAGPIDNELRFPDECVRHKVLDLVGDFALAGCDIVGRIVANRSGHALNAKMVKALLAENGVVRRAA